MSTQEDWPPSPVPTDRHLWPGERPFICFGQLGEGMLDLRVFDQTEWWVDAHGKAHLLDGPDGSGGLGGMSVAYRMAVLDHLLEHADRFHLDTIRRFILQRAGDDLLGFPDRAPIAGVEHLQDLLAMTPRQWLEQTPLVRRIRELQPS